MPRISTIARKVAERLKKHAAVKRIRLLRDGAAQSALLSKRYATKHAKAEQAYYTSTSPTVRGEAATEVLVYRRASDMARTDAEIVRERVRQLIKQERARRAALAKKK